MPTIKKPSKSNAILNDKLCADVSRVNTAISLGAVLEEVTLAWGKSEYWVKYPQGGSFKVSKRVYETINA